MPRSEGASGCEHGAAQNLARGVRGPAALAGSMPRRGPPGVAEMLTSQPPAAFDAAAAPPAPEYRNDDRCWAACGGAELVALDGMPAPPPPDKRVADCFFVHPTSYFGASWNAAWDDEGASETALHLWVAVQTAAFAMAGCRIFASIDLLEGLKGVPLKLLAFEHLLHATPS